MNKKDDCKKSHFKDHVESMTHPFCFFITKSIFFELEKKRKKSKEGKGKERKQSKWKVQERQR